MVEMGLHINVNLAYSKDGECAQFIIAKNIGLSVGLSVVSFFVELYSEELDIDQIVS